MTITSTTINRIKRVCSEIAGNTMSTSPGPWFVSHGHVISPGKNGRINGGEFDVACQPWDTKQHTVFGLNKSVSGRNDMRHIATCEPTRMAKLCTDIDELLGERDSVTVLAVRLDDLINNTEGGYTDKHARALGLAANRYLATRAS